MLVRYRPHACARNQTVSFNRKMKGLKWTIEGIVTCTICIGQKGTGDPSELAVARVRMVWRRKCSQERTWNSRTWQPTWSTIRGKSLIMQKLRWCIRFKMYQKWMNTRPRLKALDRYSTGYVRRKGMPTNSCKANGRHQKEAFCIYELTKKEGRHLRKWMVLWNIRHSWIRSASVDKAYTRFEVEFFRVGKSLNHTKCNGSTLYTLDSIYYLTQYNIARRRSCTQLYVHEQGILIYVTAE